MAQNQLRTTALEFLQMFEILSPLINSVKGDNT